MTQTLKTSERLGVYVDALRGFALGYCIVA